MKKENRFPSLGYDESEWNCDEDKVLAVTLHWENIWLMHEPNDACWCEPTIERITGLDGEIVDCLVIHRTRH